MLLINKELSFLVADHEKKDNSFYVNQLYIRRRGSAPAGQPRAALCHLDGRRTHPPPRPAGLENGLRQRLSLSNRQRPRRWSLAGPPLPGNTDPMGDGANCPSNDRDTVANSSARRRFVPHAASSSNR